MNTDSQSRVTVVMPVCHEKTTIQEILACVQMAERVR